jgi:maleylacetate reductase
MPMDFVFQSRPARVVFGADSLRHLERELLELGLERALILCTPEQRWLAESIAAELGGRAAGIFDGAVMHVPAAVVDNAWQYARSVRADGMIAAGGGSTIGLAKALALDSGMPIIAVPTTYAGSEMTPIFGITEGQLKRTGTDPRVLPRVVIYDPRLTLTLPVDISIASGLNALAHAAEGLYARDANPVTSLMAEEAIAALARGIPALFRDGGNADGRDDMLYGSWLAGSVLGNVGMALHHKLAIRWAAPSTCRTRKPTPSCCPMRWPTMPPPRRKPCAASRARSAPTAPRSACTSWRAAMARRWR